MKRSSCKWKIVRNWVIYGLYGGCWVTFWYFSSFCKCTNHFMKKSSKPEKFYGIWQELIICNKIGPTTTFLLNFSKNYSRIMASIFYTALILHLCQFAMGQVALIIPPLLINQGLSSLGQGWPGAPQHPPTNRNTNTNHFSSMVSKSGGKIK